MSSRLVKGRKSAGSSGFRRLAVGLLVLLMCGATVLPAFASTTVPLNQSLPIDGSTFQDSENDCGPNPTAPIAWHFILNKLDAGTDPGTLSLVFKTFGSKSATGFLVGNGQTQHFYVYTSSKDVLNSASAVVETQQDPNKPQLVLSHIAEGCTSPPPPPPPNPTPVTVSVSPGACVFSNNASITPVQATINPAGGATVAIRNASNTVVHTFPSSGSTFNALPGTYTWQATPSSGFQMSGPSSGSFTAGHCAPGLTPVTTNVSLGACTFNGTSLSPVTASISPTNGATIALTKVGSGLVHTFPTNGPSYSAAPGSYTWQATALSGFTLSGAASGAFTALSCGDDPVPTPVSAVVVSGVCSFASGTSITPITAAISPANGATVAVHKAGTGLVHTFPTDGTSYNAAPADYTWQALALSGHSLTGAATGAFTAKECRPSTSVLGIQALRAQPAAVSGQQLPATGPGMQVEYGLTLAAMLIIAGLVMMGAAPDAMNLGQLLSNGPGYSVITRAGLSRKPKL